MLRELASSIRHRSSHVGRYASRYHRAFRYGLDLVLWSRLFSRRGPVPIELPQSILEQKQVGHQPPTLFVSSPNADLGCWEEGFKAVYANLFLNLQMPDVLSKLRYIHPAPSFEGIYLWDSAFTAQVWKHWDLGTAFEVNQAVIDLRDGRRLQHVVTNFSESKYTQPPVMTWSMERLMRWNTLPPDEDFECQIYEPLRDYNAWLYENRRHQHGLFFWAHPYESGIDNSPRFSSRDEQIFSNTKRFSSPDICAYVVLQNEMLASMAMMLGRDGDAESYRNRADELREAVNEFLWDDVDQFYYDHDEVTNGFIRHKTIAGLLPLWAGIPDASRAEALRQQILDPKLFNTEIPLPSVSKADLEFSKDMWRGPVWINTAYAVIQGLKRYGFNSDVADLSFRLCHGVYKTFSTMRRFYEFYDPDRYDLDELHRKKGNQFKKLTLGSKPVSEFVGWSGLVNTLVIEELIGFRKEAGQILIRPNFPKSAEGLGFSLRLPQEKLAISIDLLPGGHARCMLREQAGVSEFCTVRCYSKDADKAEPERQLVQ